MSIACLLAVVLFPLEFKNNERDTNTFSINMSFVKVTAAPEVRTQLHLTIDETIR